MNTEALVKRLIELVEAGKNVQAEEELYAQDVVSFEQDGRVEKGLEAIIAKTKAAGAYFEEFYGTKVTEAFVAPHSFLLEFTLDAKPKGGERMQMVESGFYKVEEGKIVEEYFYAQPFEI